MPGPPLLKSGLTPSMERKIRSRRLKADETREKGIVRIRDRRCRFPLCGCQRPRTDPMKAFLTVSHDFHKGMGGNPTGEVSIAPLMIALCRWRHQDAPVSRHAGTVQTRYLTPDHNDGPVAWLVDLRAVYPSAYTETTWFEVAREDYDEGDRTDFRLEPLTDEQQHVLADLAMMTR